MACSLKSVPRSTDVLLRAWKFIKCASDWWAKVSGSRLRSVLTGTFAVAVSGRASDGCSSSLSSDVELVVTILFFVKEARCSSSNLQHMKTHPPATTVIGGMRLVRASDYVLPAVIPRRPHRWADVWRDLYYDYLRSPEWWRKRNLVVAQSNGICQCGRPVDDVHHLTYDRVFEEDLDDLVGLCRQCHLRCHGIEF